MIQVKVAYISNKPPLVVEHAFPLMGFVGLSANATYVKSQQMLISIDFPGEGGLDSLSPLWIHDLLIKRKTLIHFCETKNG